MIARIWNRVVPACALTAMVLGFGAGCVATRYPKENLPISIAWREAEKEGLPQFVSEINPMDCFPQVVDCFGPINDWTHPPDVVAFLLSDSIEQITHEAFCDLLPEAMRWLVKTVPSSDGEPIKSILILQDVRRTFKSKEAKTDERLDYAFGGIRREMLKSDVMNDHFILLSDKEDKGKEVLDLATRGEPVTIYDPTSPDVTGLSAYPPEHVYVVKASLSRFERPSERLDLCYVQFTLDLVLAKPLANMDIAATSISRNYYYHPYRLLWISEDECNKLQEDYDAWIQAGKPKYEKWLVTPNSQ